MTPNIIALKLKEEPMMNALFRRRFQNPGNKLNRSNNIMDKVHTFTDYYNDLMLKPSKGKGLGVFVKRDFEPGEIIEVAPCIRDTTRGFSDYVFSSDFDPRESVLALGLASMVNHSDNPNTDYWQHPNKLFMIFKAIKHIPEGAEVTISYGDGWWKSRPDKIMVSSFNPYFNGYPYYRYNDEYDYEYEYYYE